jgi:hypothetical protein
MAEGMTSFTHSLPLHGGKGFIGSVQEEGHDKRTGASRGEGASRVAHGELPMRNGRMGLKWKTRLGMEKGSVKEECPLGGQEGIKNGGRC